MRTQNSDDVSAPAWQLDVIRAPGHVQGCVCVFVHRGGRWLKDWITLLWFIHGSAPSPADRSPYNARKGTYMWALWGEGRVVTMTTISKKAVENMERADGWKSSISSSGFLKSTARDDIPASLCTRLPPTVGTIKNKGKKRETLLPRYIFFSPSLFTEAVVCDRSGGRSQVPRKLTAFLLSTANKCSRSPLHTDVHGPVDR